MKIVVTNIYSYDNKGDAAIVLALVSEIRRVFPKADLTLLTTDAKNDKDKYGAPVSSSLMWVLFSAIKDLPIVRRVYELVTRMGGLLLYLMFYKLFRKPFYGLLKKEVRVVAHHINESDMVIACGGGYLGTADASPKSILLLFGMCLSFLMGHYARKPVYLYSQSIGPLHDWFAKAIVRFSLNRVDLIEVREDISMEYMKSLKVRTPYIRTADPALLLRGQRRPAPIRLKKASLQVGTTVRKWFTTEEERANYRTILAKLIDYMVTEYDAQVTYIPQVIAQGFGDDDRLVAKRLWEQVEHKDRFTVLTDNLHPFELIDLCGKMDIFVGTRMHSNIFALLGDVPVVGIKYEHKTQGIMDGLGIGDATIDIKKINYEDLQQKVDMVIKNSKHYKELISQNMPGQIALSSSAMDRIKEEFDKLRPMVAERSS